MLDPACGSGAFPMGILQKMVRVLEKVDPESNRWKELQLEKIPSRIIRRMVRKRLDDATVEYARKLGIIQHSIYGVDIQPIAAEISKLRCFLSLVVDEQVDESKDNWNIEPLPNLEFKFLAADSLQPLPKEDSQPIDLFGSSDLLTKLGQIRDDYLQAYGEDKEILKEQFKEIQNAILDKELKDAGRNKSDRAIKLSSWEPFEDSATSWFDPLWMFGIQQFDVVLGNPPYGGDKISHDLKKALGLGSRDPYGAFLARFLPEGTEKSPLANEGLLCFIVSDTFMTIKTHYPLREKLMDNYIHKMIRVHKDTFGATVNTAIALCERNEFPVDDETQKPVRQFDDHHTCLMADLTQTSIHKEHERFLELLEKTVQYVHPLPSNGVEERVETEDGVLFMRNNGWTIESSEEYALYSYPQALINRNSNKPFFVASPKLFHLLNDRNSIDNDSQSLPKKKFNITINNRSIDLYRLGDEYDGRGENKEWKNEGLFKVVSGIKTGRNKKYLRIISNNATKNYKIIDRSLVIENEEIESNISTRLRERGISSDKYFVPFEVGRKSNAKGGLLPCYRSVETNVVINWSEQAVSDMKSESHSDLANSEFRFRKLDDQISFSATGEYAPTFREANAPVFLNKASRVFLEKRMTNFECMGILNSKIIKYIAKNYSNHTVEFGVDDLKLILLNLNNLPRIGEKVREIINKQKENITYDYSSNEQINIDYSVYDSYALNKSDIREVENWYARRYPRLVQAQKENLEEQGKPADYLELYQQLDEEGEIEIEEKTHQ